MYSLANLAVHGGIDHAEMEALGLKPEEILDFSANLNPFGPPQQVRKALARADISSYPDSRSFRLRKALAEKLGLEIDNIIAGSGSTEIMRLAALAFFKAGDKALIVGPAFGEYEAACRIAGAEAIKYTLRAEDSFNIRVSELRKTMEKTSPAGLFMANPGNPTGCYYSRDLVEKLIDLCKDTLFVLDEAYISFVEPAETRWHSLDLIKNNRLLILRSMTKDYALAGLRLGYGIAGKEIIAALQRICPPWNVNVMAQEAGLCAIKSDSYLAKSLDKIRKERAYLIEGLKALGMSPLASSANFFLIKTGSGARWRRELLRKKILVRDCASFGLPEYIRISVRKRDECDRLLAAMREVL